MNRSFVRVVTIATHPNEDQFLSGSLDGTVRLWDFNASASWASIPFGTGRPVASYDPEGLIMAIGVGSEEIKLHDIRKIGAVSLELHSRRTCVKTHTVCFLLAALQYLETADSQFCAMDSIEVQS